MGNFTVFGRPDYRKKPEKTGHLSIAVIVLKLEQYRFDTKKPVQMIIDADGMANNCLYFGDFCVIHPVLYTLRPINTLSKY